jgi:hypothetical protein
MGIRALRFEHLWVAVGAGLVLACSGGDGAPVVPSRLEVAGGDNQSAAIGAALADPLRVRVVGSDNAPYPNATVQWQVTAGGGAVAPGSSVTDAAGLASTALTLGTTIGFNRVSATVSGLTPAMFTAEALDPCDIAPPIGIGGTANGTLGPLDCALPDGSFIDYFQLPVPSQQAVQIDMMSGAFDAFLLLFDGNASLVGADDDAGSGTDSRMRAIVRPALYRIGANSLLANQTGAYTVSATAASEDAAACAVLFVTTGINTAQTITTVDCPSSGFYADIFLITLRAGQTVTLDEHSSAFDAYMGLGRLSTGTIVAIDDDSGPGLDAQIVYTSPATDLFVIIAATFAAGATGAYTLGVQ